LSSKKRRSVSKLPKQVFRVQMKNSRPPLRIRTKLLKRPQSQRKRNLLRSKLKRHLLKKKKKNLRLQPRKSPRQNRLRL